MHKDIKILIVQPILTGYRVPIFNKLSNIFRCYYVFSTLPEEKGYETTDDDIRSLYASKPIHLIRNKLWYQTHVIRSILKVRPDYLFITASVRNVSFWVALFVSRILGVRVISHGQGLYRNNNISNLNKLVFYFLMEATWVYACYTDLSKRSVSFLPARLAKKLFVADNMLINTDPVLPHQKSGKEKSVLFIGRIRNGSQIQLLADAVEYLRDTLKRDIRIEIIGSGECGLKMLRQSRKLNYITFHGPLYDPKEISRLAKKCFCGCYPGNAGLSVVHFMSLSLLPIVHSSFGEHMGPEPSYVIDGYNGLLFEKDNISSLIAAIESAYSNLENRERLSSNAYHTYLSLLKPDMADKISDRIISNNH